MFDSIVREVVEEIGVPAATLVSYNQWIQLENNSIFLWSFFVIYSNILVVVNL